jgi:hypothetical protein
MDLIYDYSCIRYSKFVYELPVPACIAYPVLGSLQSRSVWEFSRGKLILNGNPGINDQESVAPYFGGSRLIGYPAVSLEDTLYYDNLSQSQVSTLII